MQTQVTFSCLKDKSPVTTIHTQVRLLFPFSMAYLNTATPQVLKMQKWCVTPLKGPT